MSPSPRPRRRRRWLAIIALALIALLASGFVVLRVAFEGEALGDKIATNLNKRMRGRIEIGAIHWETSAIKKVLSGGWIPVTFENVRVWDDCALNSGAGALDEVRQGDPNEDCTLDDQPDPDPTSKRRPRKLLLQTDKITGEIDIHALMFGNHDFVIRHLWVHGGEVMIEQTREPYPLHAYDRTIVSILTAFYPRMKAGFRAGIYADAPGPIFDLRDIHIKNLNATVHMTPNTSLGAMWGFGTTARIEGLDVDADEQNLKNNSYLYMDPVDPLVAKFYVRLEAAAKKGIVRLWDDGPRESFRMPKPGEAYPPPGRKKHTSYEIPVADIKLNRLAQLPGEWTRGDFVANTLELDIEAKTVPCEHERWPVPDPKLGASMHVTGELYNYWDRPYDGSWNLKVDGKNLGQTVRTCVHRDFGGDKLEGKITLTGPFVANPKIGLSMTNLDYDVELSSNEPPLPLTLAEVEGSIDMVNEQGSLDKTTALIRGGKEPGEVVVAATFGVSPFNARAHVEIVKPIDVARFLPDSLEPVGTLVQGRFTAVGDSEIAFALEDFDLSLGRTATEKAVRAYKGRLFTKDQFDTVKLQKVRIEAGRTRASLDGTIDALHDFNCSANKYCKGHDTCAPCSVTRLEIDGCAPDLGYWLRRFGLPAYVESACSTSNNSPGAPIVITGPLTKPKMNVATELAGLPCVDKLSIVDSQFDAASGVLDIRKMKTSTLGGTLEGNGRIRTGDTPVIEKLAVTGRKLDPQKICGLGTMVKGTIDAVDVELAGTIVKREPLEWLNLAKVYARADKLTVLGEKFTNIATCINRSDDGKCRPRKDYLDADDLAQCEAGKKSGFCAVATATREGGGIVDATVARLPATKKGTTVTPPRLTGTVAASDVPVAILEQLLTPNPAPVPGAKTPAKPATAPFAAGGVASMTLHLEGSPDAPQAAGAVQLLRTWVESSFIGDMQIAVTPGKIGNMPGVSFAGTALAGRLTVSGTLGTQAPYPVELTLGGRRIDLDVLLDLKKRLPMPIPMPMQAWVTGTVFVRHELRPTKPVEPVAWIELSELTGVVTHRGDDGRLVPLTVTAVDQDRAKQPAVSLRVTPSSIEFACRDNSGVRFDCTTKLAIGPQGGKPAGTIDFKGRVTPQDVAIQADGKLDLAALEPIVEAQFSCVSGTADLSASIKGNYKKPSYEASLAIKGIQLTPIGGDDTILEAQSGLIKLANGSLGFTDVKLRVRDTYRDASGGRRGAKPDAKSCAGRSGGTARDEAGELFVKGNIELDGLTPKSWGVLIEGKLAGKMLGLLAKDHISQASGLARIEGDLQLFGKGPRPTIQGTLSFDPPPVCGTPDAKPGDCLRPGEQTRSITVLPRLLRREIALERGKLEIETKTDANDVRSYEVSVAEDLVLKIGGEGHVTALKSGKATIRDGTLAFLDVKLDANALAFQQPGKLDLVVDAKNVQIVRDSDNSNLSIEGDLTIADGSFRQDFDILDNTIRALRSNAPPSTPIWEASPLIGNALLDINIDVRKFSLKSNITTIDMSGRQIKLSQTPRDPRLNGTIRIDGGNFKLPGMRARFTRTSGEIRFEQGFLAGNPDLKIASEADYRDLSGQDHVVTLSISQRAANPEWNLTTSTGYNKSQTVALLLLGRNPEQLRRSLGDQILGSNINNIDPTTNPTQGFADQIVKDLAGDWVSDLLENSLTKITGLDVFRVEVGFGSIGLRVEKKLPGLENMNLIGTFEQTIRGNTLNVRADAKATYKISVQGGFLGKYFNDPAEEDIRDTSGRVVFRILP